MLVTLQSRRLDNFLIESCTFSLGYLGGKAKVLPTMLIFRVLIRHTSEQVGLFIKA